MSASINTVALQTAMGPVFAAVEAGQKANAAYREAIAAVRPIVAGQDRPIVRTALLPIVAAAYGCSLAEGAGKAKGTIVLDSECAAYEGTKKALQRIVADIMGDSPAKGAKATEEAEIEVPADIAKLAAKLVALCNEYEGSRKLAALAIAQAFAA